MHHPDIPPELVEAIARREAVLFVGAGLSVAAGLPGWRDLLTPLADHIGLPADRRSDLAQVAQFCVNRLGRQPVLQHIIAQTETAGRTPTANHRRLLALGLPEWVTTNYDDLLERTLQEAAIPHRVVVDDTELPFGVGPDGVSLFKVHGDRGRPPSMVIARDDYVDHWKRRPQLQQKLTQLLAEKTFLFLGYSLGDLDFALIHAEVGRSLGGFRRPAYAVLFDPDSFTAEDLERHHIRVIALSAATAEERSQALAAWLEALAQAVRAAGGGRPRPATALVPVPPGPVPRLFGRDAFLHDLVAALTGPTDADRPLALVGPPGVGKTALALALAHREEVAAAFPDGRAWLALGPEPDLLGLLGRLLDQFGAGSEGLSSVEARSDRLRRLLAGRRYLLALDDVWQDGHAQPFVEAVLPPARVLLTTRRNQEADDLRSVCYDVRRLKPADAVAMLADAGAGARAAVAADREGAAALAAAVGHLPLALHVVGRRLNALARALKLKPAAAIKTLKDGLDRELLTLPAARPRPGVEEAEPSLEAALALSYRALPDEGARRAFRRLAVFGGQPLDFDLAAAAAVWKVDADAALATMVVLVGEGLVETGREDEEEVRETAFEREAQAGPLRYRLHQVIARFAEARLATDPAEARAARLAHARHYAGIVADYDDAIRKGRMRYSAPPEWEQVAQALKWLSDEASRDDGAARILVEYSRHWRNVLYNSHDPRRERWLEAAAQAAARVGSDRDRANVLWAQGDVLAFLARRDEALARYDAALALYRAVGDRLGEANVLQAQGDVLAFLDRRDEALARYDAALALYRAVGDRLGEANVLKAQGDVLAFQKRNDEALARYDAALALYRAVGARLGEANVLQAQGDVLAFLDRRDEALARYDAALALYRAVGDRLGEANVYHGLGRLALAQGQAQEARRWTEQAIALHEANGSRYDVALDCKTLARACRAAGDIEAAIAAWHRSAENYRAIGLHAQAAEALNYQGDLLDEAGRQEEALAAYAEAVALAPDKAMLRRDYAHQLIKLGRLDEAAAQLDAAAALEPDAPYLALRRAQLAQARGDRDEARRWAEEALRRQPDWDEAKAVRAWAQGA